MPQPRLCRLFCTANRVLLPGSAPGSLVFCTQLPLHGQRKVLAWEPARCCALPSEAPLPSSLTFPLVRRRPWVQKPSLLQSALPGAQAPFRLLPFLSPSVSPGYEEVFLSVWKSEALCRHSVSVPCEWFPLYLQCLVGEGELHVLLILHFSTSSRCEHFEGSRFLMPKEYTVSLSLPWSQPLWQ